MSMTDFLPAIDQADTFFQAGDDGDQFSEMNKGVHPIFYEIQEEDKLESEKCGMPRVRTVEIVQIRVAGDQFSSVCHPVDQAIKQRFHREYKRWKESKTQMTVTGTPINMWPAITPQKVAELRLSNIHSVEDLADMADTYIEKIFEGRTLRDKARAWLAQAKDGAAAMKFAAENERLKERLDEQDALLKELLAEKRAREEAKTPAKKG
jgi:hypothetical protein